MARRRIRTASLIAALLLIAAPAAGQTTEGCTIDFNGVDVERIDSLNSPLELSPDDMLIFNGSDPDGTRSAVVRLYIGPIAIESGTTTYTTPETDFTVTISMDDISPYGVGLFRAEGVTDGCSAGAWVRLSGRFPLATLTGLTAIGLTIGGATGQLGAISSRRRWARTAAALGGIATGTGAALLGQQFGRLQLSYVSVAALIGAAGFLGWLLASLLNPGQRERRRARRETERQQPQAARPTPAEPARSSETPTPDPTEPGARVAGTPSAEEPRARTEQEAQIESKPDDSPAKPPDDSPAAPQPPPPTGPYWCYVLAPTDVFDLNDHTRKVATINPGSWYLVKRTVSGWAHVAVGDEAEGWVAESAVHRQG